MRELPKCAVLTCTNEADPRWFARDVNGSYVMICDGHQSMPRPDEVAACPPPLSVQDLAKGITRDGRLATSDEAVRIAQALLVETERTRVLEAELIELRVLADLVNQVDIRVLPPELLAVRHCGVAAHRAEEIADLSEGLRAPCASIPGQDLRAVIAVHRENCHLSGCLVLAALEVQAAEMEASS